MREIDATSEVEAPGEVPASTGGVVDLDRILGTIPVVLVFMEDLTAPAERELLRSLGDRLADFGHERTQVLGVAPVGSDEVGDLVAGVGGNARVLADADRSLAARLAGPTGPGASPRWWSVPLAKLRRPGWMSRGAPSPRSPGPDQSARRSLTCRVVRFVMGNAPPGTAGRWAVRSRSGPAPLSLPLPAWGLPRRAPRPRAASVNPSPDEVVEAQRAGRPLDAPGGATTNQRVPTSGS